MELDFFSLECNEVSILSFELSMGFGVTLGSLYLGAQGCVPLLLENLLGMSCPETCFAQRGLQHYMEKIRVRRELEVTQMR